MYEVVFSDLAKKQFLKLPKDIQNRIISALERIRVRPEVYITKLIDESSYKFRAGDYRIIMDIQKDKFILFVLKVGHRKNIYD